MTAMFTSACCAEFGVTGVAGLVPLADSFCLASISKAALVAVLAVAGPTVVAQHG